MSPWATPSALAFALVVGLAVYVARHGAPAGLGRPLLVTLLGAGLFALSDFAGYLVQGPTADWLALVGLYGGLLLGVPAWWMASLRFARQHDEAPFASPRRLVERAPVALSAAFFLLLVTNPWHGSFLTPAPGVGRSLHGPGWVACAAYGYGTLAASVAVLLRVALRSRSAPVRTHAWLLAGACALPTLGNVAYALAPEPLPFDPTGTGLALGAVLFVFGIDRRQLFTVSPRLLAEVVRQDTEPVLVLDGGGALVHANPAAFAWLELPEGARPADVPERLAARLRDIQRGEPLDPTRLRAGLLAPGRSLHALFRMPDERWLRLSSKTLPDRRGGASEVLVRLRDETPLHRVSEALAEQAATLDAVLASSGDGILVVDWPDGRVRYVNRPFVDIVGLGRHPRVGDDAETVRREVHAAVRDPEELDLMIDRGLREPRALVPLAIPTRDGRVVEGSARPVLREGRVVARLFQVRDVTERRRAEDAVRLSQKLESLSVMAGGIAHDFNNVLVSVLGNAELARDALPEGAEALGPLGEVESAAGRATELTRQLLAYAGRSEVDPREVDLSAVTRDTLSLVGVSIPPAVRVESSLAATPPAVVGDPAQLHQVAMNLVLNAAEALASQGGCVRVETGVAYVSRDTRIVGIDGEVSPGRPLVFLRVSDDGPGIDPETRERIFDPFFTTKRGGRGLGLAATLGIVRSHGGTLQVDSTPGEGSAFTVLLPSTGRAARSPERERPEPERPWRGAGLVLVVDDEPGVLRVARRILEAAGFEVETAEDGARALERWDARGGGYRAVLLDLTMPRLSGEETWREIRKRDPEVPVLFSSGYPEARPRVGSVVGGRADRSAFVAKPYTRAVLLEALRGLLEPPGREPERGLR